MSNNEEFHEECQHEHVFERLSKRYVQPGNDSYVGAADGEYCINDLRYFGSLKNSRHVITHLFCGLITLAFGLVVVIKQTFRWSFVECLYIGIFEIAASVAIFMKKDKTLLVVMVTLIFLLNCILTGTILTRFVFERDRLEVIVEHELTEVMRPSSFESYLNSSKRFASASNNSTPTILDANGIPISKNLPSDTEFENPDMHDEILRALSADSAAMDKKGRGVGFRGGFGHNTNDENEGDEEDESNPPSIGDDFELDLQEWLIK